MRSDFSKVITERPRAGGLFAYKKIRRTQKRIGEDDVGGNQSMRRCYGYNQKEFTDLLGPLHRFLYSRAGKPWNKVYSEICENLKGRNTTQQHVLQHLDQMVEKHLYVGSDYKLYDERSRRFMATTSGGFRGAFYVDPRDGALKACKPVDWRRNRATKPLTDFIVDGKSYSMRGGNWFEVIITTQTRAAFICETRTFIAVPAEKKRQLCAKELRSLGISNTHKE